MQTLTDPQTVTEIRREVPLEKGDAVAAGSPADILCEDAKIKRANDAARKRSDEAWNARVAAHGGPPQGIYEATVELREAELAERGKKGTGAAMLDDLAANLERIDAEQNAADAELVAEGVAFLDSFELRLQASARRRKAISLAKRGKGVAAPMTDSRTGVRIPGGESLHNLRAGLEALLLQEPTRYVSPLAYSRLQVGEDVEDIDGAPLPFTVAEELKRAGRLRVANSPDGLRSRGAGQA